MDSITNDIVEITQQMILKRSMASGQDEAPFKRANMVAICSVMKSLDYWALHPKEIPPLDRIEDYLFFDIATGKPKESFVAGTLVRAIAELMALKE